MAIKYLRETKGNIINMTSMSGVHGQVNATAYVTTKVRDCNVILLRSIEMHFLSKNSLDLVINNQI